MNAGARAWAQRSRAGGRPVTFVANEKAARPDCEMFYIRTKDRFTNI